jgi:hypothetical protein
MEMMAIKGFGGRCRSRLLRAGKRWILCWKGSDYQDRGDQSETVHEKAQIPPIHQSETWLFSPIHEPKQGGQRRGETATETAGVECRSRHHRSPPCRETEDLFTGVKLATCPPRALLQRRG